MQLAQRSCWTKEKVLSTLNLLIGGLFLLIQV